MYLPRRGGICENRPIVESLGRDLGAPSRGSAAGWLSPLIGREAELDQVAGLLERTRLVTLTGAGGVGKTRLALGLVNRWPVQEDEPVFVELAPLDPSDGDPALLEPVASAVWNALAPPGAGVAHPIGGPLEAAARQLADRPALVVLDNCEHLAVAPAVAELLLRRCPGVRVLATSRLPLDLAGETIWQVPPLSLPEARAPDPLAALTGSEAGRLFAERARRSVPAFSLTQESAPVVAEICRRLDGLPLAIELAAPRVRILSPSQILDGLVDQFRLLEVASASTLTRHRTLEASLDWSYQLIDEDARALLRMLAVAYDWSLRAIEAVWTREGSVLDALGAVVDAGMLATVPNQESFRYHLLETVRSYAGDRLRATPDEHQIRLAHLAYFRTLAAEANGLLDDDAGRGRLELETRNLQEALDFAVANEPDVALEMASGMRYWLLVAGNHGDARRLCARVLGVAGEADPVARAHVLLTAALLCVFDEDYPGARTYAEEAIPLAQASGDPGAMGVGLMLASVGRRSVNPSESAKLGLQAVGLLRSADDRHGLVLAVAQLAMTEALRDRFDAMRRAWAEFQVLTQGRPPAWLAIWLELALAWADVAQGDPHAALAHCERGFALEGDRRSLGYYVALSHKLHAMTLIGQSDRALALGTAAIAEAQEAGFAVAVAAVEAVVGVTELALGKLESARERAEHRFGDAHVAGAANAHELLARIDLAERRPGPLGRHAAALRTTGQHTGSPRLLALAGWADGSAALLEGRLEEAANPLHEGLALQIENRLLPDAIDTLEALAELQIDGGRPESGARLLGAAQRARADLDVCRVPPGDAHFAGLQQRGRESLSSERWTAAVQAGAEMTLDVALDYARRGRGQRVSSTGGLAGLTPTERRVAEAAADGLTNAAIGARLFMSHGTVKTHLAHAYKKLGVANRLQLATLVHAGTPQPTSDRAASSHGDRGLPAA